MAVNATPVTPDPYSDDPVELGPPPRWWEETPAEAARYDRYYFDRDED